MFVNCTVSRAQKKDAKICLICKIKHFRKRKQHYNCRIILTGFCCRSFFEGLYVRMFCVWRTHKNKSYLMCVCVWTRVCVHFTRYSTHEIALGFKKLSKLYIFWSGIGTIRYLLTYFATPTATVLQTSLFKQQSESNAASHRDRLTICWLTCQLTLCLLEH